MLDADCNYTATGDRVRHALYACHDTSTGTTAVMTTEQCDVESGKDEVREKCGVMRNAVYLCGMIW